MSDEKHEVTVEETPDVHGLVHFASSRPEKKPIAFEQDPSIVDWVDCTPKTSLFKYFRFFRYRKYDCGHRGPKAFAVRIYGRALLPPKKRPVKLCPDCSLKELKQQTIRCCLCGGGIIPGEPIAIYDVESVESKDFEFKVIDGLAIGCMLWDCAPSGLHFAGNWNGTGITEPDWDRFLK